MAVAATYPISLTSVVNEFNPTFTPRGVIIANYSADNLAFDNTVDPILLIPPGVRAPIVIGHYVSTLRVRSASNTTGSASITIMDSVPDMTGAPNLQQLPGTITAVIPSTSTVTTKPDPTGVQTTSPQVPIVTRVHCSNNTQVVVLTRPAFQIAVQCDEPTITIGGYLSIFTVFTLADLTASIRFVVSQVYILPDTYASLNSMIPYTDDVQLPTGGAISVQFSGHADFIVTY